MTPTHLTTLEAEELIILGYESRYGVKPESVWINPETNFRSWTPDDSGFPEITVEFHITLPKQP